MADRLNNAAPLLFVLLWSSSFLGTRVGLRHMSPLWFVALRMILAAAIVCGATIALRRSRFRGFGACRGRGLAALRRRRRDDAGDPADDRACRDDPHQAAPIALIQTLNPLLCALLAWPLLGERLRPTQILGLLLGFAGVLLILGLAALNSSRPSCRTCSAR